MRFQLRKLFFEDVWPHYGLYTDGIPQKKQEIHYYVLGKSTTIYDFFQNGRHPYGVSDDKMVSQALLSSNSSSVSLSRLPSFTILCRISSARSSNMGFL